MTQETMADFFSLSDASNTVNINYYTQAPGPFIAGRPTGPRLEYQGPEGKFVFPSSGVGGGNINIQKGSVLGSLFTVVLVPTVDAKTVSLTLVIPPINMAGQDEQDFSTLAIKTTSSGILPKEGALLTYEVIFLKGTAQMKFFATEIPK